VAVPPYRDKRQGSYETKDRVTGVCYIMSELPTYQIKYKGEVIAEFPHDFDRDTCLNAFENEHPDCEFECCEDDQ